MQKGEVIVNITVIKRKAKNSRVEVKGENVKVIIPIWANEKAVLKKVMPWIEKAVKRQKELYQKAEKLTLYKRSLEEFKEYVRKKVEEYSKELDVRIMDVKFRKMKRKWGSCSLMGRITINKLCSYLPDELIDYIVFHEVLHRRYMDHGRNFKHAIRKKFLNWKELEYSLKLYSIKMQMRDL